MSRSCRLLAIVRSFPIVFPIVFATVFMLFGFNAPVLAQELDSPAVEEITVTARKRTESLQDVPATVTVFTEQRIERSNINRASEIALLTPGVSLVDAAEAGDTQVNIRGMNGARDAENSYALVIDGITMTNPAALNREYSNLQQIEVLKGPQGAIYGRNGSAGAFIISTKEPGDELAGQLQASVGQDDTYELIGSAGGRMTDWLRGSFQGEYTDTDGFYNNNYLNKDDIVDNNETWALTGRLIFDISDSTTIDTKLRHGEVDASSITFNSVFHIPGFVGFLGPDAYENVNGHDFNFYNNVIHTNKQETTEFSIKLDQELSWANLTTWGLYSDIKNELGADGTSAAFGFFFTDPACIDSTADRFDDGVQINPPQFIGPDPGSSVFGAYTPTTCDGTQFQRRDQEDYSFEFRLSSNDEGPLQWMGGLYYLNIDREVAVSTGVDNIRPGTDPIYTNGTVTMAPYVANIGGAGNPTEQLAWDDFDTDVYSVFGQISYDFTDTFTADLALRWDREEREVNSRVPTVADGAISQFINTCPAIDGLTPGVDTPLNASLCPSLVGSSRSKSRNFDEFQPKLSFSWDAIESTTLFGSWGVGFRSGGFNNTGSEATVNTFINNRLYNGVGTDTGLCNPRGTPNDPALGQNPYASAADCVNSSRSRVGIKDDYDEETSSAFEAGFKSELFDNALRLEGAAYYTEVDDMQFFEFVVGPFGLLRVVENVDEVHVKGIELAATWAATNWLDLYIGGNLIDTEIKKNEARPDTVGNDSPYTPEYNANLGAYLTIPVGANLNFFTNLDVAAIGDTWFHVVQDQERPIGFEVDFGVGGPFTPGEYSVTERDSYILTNLRTGIESENWTAAIWVNNLTDEEFLEEVIPAPEFGGSFDHPGSERRFGADVTLRF